MMCNERSGCLFRRYLWVDAAVMGCVVGFLSLSIVRQNKIALGL